MKGVQAMGLHPAVAGDGAVLEMQQCYGAVLEVEQCYGAVLDMEQCYGAVLEVHSIRAGYPTCPSSIPVSISHGRPMCAITADSELLHISSPPPSAPKVLPRALGGPEEEKTIIIIIITVKKKKKKPVETSKQF